MSPRAHFMVWTLSLGVPVALVYAAALWAGTTTDGPVEVAWDREPCAECRMHVGEPGFAAQLHTEDGQVLNFDDPGCALRFVARESLAIRALYFHHHEEDTWLSRNQTAFVPVSSSPMGYGLAATRQGIRGSLSFAAATAKVLEAQRASAP